MSKQLTGMAKQISDGIEALRVKKTDERPDGFKSFFEFSNAVGYKAHKTLANVHDNGSISNSTALMLGKWLKYKGSDLHIVSRAYKTLEKAGK
tara:strand:- start:203 stop:481 length:279 start_codon:yes stop_codon:yes gene_type:complete